MRVGWNRYLDLFNPQMALIVYRLFFTKDYCIPNHKSQNLKFQTNYNAFNSKPEQPAYAKTLRWASVLRLDIFQITSD